MGVSLILGVLEVKVSFGGAVFESLEALSFQGEGHDDLVSVLVEFSLVAVSTQEPSVVSGNQSLESQRRRNVFGASDGVVSSGGLEGFFGEGSSLGLQVSLVLSVLGVDLSVLGAPLVSLVALSSLVES